MVAHLGSEARIKAAIIGGGPAGLAAAIALSDKPFVEWALYEKKAEISEIGSGITLQPNTWKMLEKLGVSHYIGADDIFRQPGEHRTTHRNGRTGLLLSPGLEINNQVPPHQEACRTHRSVLQNALLRKVDQNQVFVGKKLNSITRLPSKKLIISFEDGFTDEVDLLIGADGIRSVVRQFAFPTHGIQYTGSTAYRTLVRASDASKVNGFPREVIFWHGTSGKWVYTCPLGGNDWEISCSIKESRTDGRTSWGKPASVRHFLDSFSEFCQPIREVFKLVTYVDQYDSFAGPRLEQAVNFGSVALIGDALHPLSGAFGAGAGFALEDAYTLSRAMDWAAESGRQVSEALKLFDEVRSPHYKDIYDVLDDFATMNKRLAAQNPEPDEEISERVRQIWGERRAWIYSYQVEEVIDKAIEEKGRSS